MTNFKPVTYGQFEAKGIITVLPETFQVDLKGKNNPSWNYSRINMKMEDGNGGSFYLNAQDGFSMTNPYPLSPRIKDSQERLTIQFADRHNQQILEQVEDNDFIKVGLRKVENEEGKMVWDYVKFLTLYDAINFIKDRFQTGMKLYVRGRTGYSTFNDRLNKDFTPQMILLLPEDEETELGFKFTQTVLLTSDSVDDSKFDDEMTASVNAKLYLKKKKDVYEVLTLPLTVRATEENKDKIKRVIDKYLKVEGDKVRRIRLEGKYSLGYAQGQVKEEDLPAEALELIEDGLYTKEEVLKMYVNRDRVDEMNIIRPFVIKPRNEGEKPKLDMDDETYTLDDLINLEVEVEPEVVVSNDDEDEDLSFLEDLD